MNAAEFITSNLKLGPVSALPQIRLYTAHPGSRLSRLFSPDGAAPYWAYSWAGGLALAQHVLRHPRLVAGKHVLDLGAGSGLVGIAAALAGAHVSAAEIDSYGCAAITLNAAANGVHLPLVEIDIAGDAPDAFEMILAGDVFYLPEVAASMLPFLHRSVEAGIAVLIGDPGRRDLPVDQLIEVTSYPVGDVGDVRDRSERVGTVYMLNAEQTSS